jgi:hypothetical protein
MAILGTVARVVQPVAGAFEKGLQQDIVEAVVDIITRHPVSQQELQVILADWAPGELKHVLATLQASGKAQSVERYGRTFWTAGTSRFPSQAESRRTKPKPGSPRVRLSSAREMSGSAPATPKSMADPHDED